MKRKQLIYISIILLLGSITSCQTTKMIDGNCFGGSGLSNSKMNQSPKRQTYIENTLGSEASVENSTNQKSTIAEIPASETAREESYKSYKNVAYLLKKNLVSSKKNIENIKDQPTNSTAIDKTKDGSKFGMWILFILGFPIAIVGFLLTMVGIFDSLFGGALLTNIGLIMFALGVFFIWRAFKIRKKLKNGE